jgi:hypothetical protein
MYRIWCAVAVFVITIIAASMTFWSGHWASGLATFVAGSVLSAQIAIGFFRSFESTGIRAGYAIAMLLGITAVFVEHRYFEPGRPEVQTAGLLAFAQLDVSQCPGRRSEFIQFQHLGTEACAMQNIRDQMDVIQELHKAEKLPGELSLGDSIYQLSKPGTSDRCIDLMRILDKACPYVLSKKTKSQLAGLKRQ